MFTKGESASKVVLVNEHGGGGDFVGPGGVSEVDVDSANSGLEVRAETGEGADASGGVAAQSVTAVLNENRSQLGEQSGGEEDGVGGKVEVGSGSEVGGGVEEKHTAG